MVRKSNNIQQYQYEVLVTFILVEIPKQIFLLVCDLFI